MRRVRKGGGLFLCPGLIVGEREEMIRRSQWGRDREEKEVKGEREEGLQLYCSCLPWNKGLITGSVRKTTASRLTEMANGIAFKSV